MDNITVFTDAYGDKRNGVEIVCLNCGKKHVTRFTNTKFCSSTCSSRFKSLSHRIKVNCAYCHNEFTITKHRFQHSAKSHLHFCTRKCKDEAQRIGGIEAIQPDHYGTGNREYRNLFLRNNGKLKCTRCGYDEFECVIDIHHVDENRTNNSKENLVALCSNCHRGLHNGKWKF